MIKQLRFKEMRTLRPPKPTIRDVNVALLIAMRIVDEINLDEYYWKFEELPDRICDIQYEIMLAGKPATVFRRLEKKQPIILHNGTRGMWPYGRDGLERHCEAIADDIASEELAKAVKHWYRRYA